MNLDDRWWPCTFHPDEGGDASLTFTQFDLVDPALGNCVSGYDVEAVVKRALSTASMGLARRVRFDSEASMFCVLARDEADLAHVASVMRGLCIDLASADRKAELPELLRLAGAPSELVRWVRGVATAADAWARCPLAEWAVIVAKSLEASFDARLRAALVCLVEVVRGELDAASPALRALETAAAGQAAAVTPAESAMVPGKPFAEQTVEERWSSVVRSVLRHASQRSEWAIRIAARQLDIACGAAAAGRYREALGRIDARFA